MRPPGKYHLLIALSSLSAIGGVALAIGTRWGIGLSPDSAIYIGAARNLLSGDGLSISTSPGEYAPMTINPPLFSALLAVIGLLGVDPVNGAQWLNVFLFAANVFLVGILVASNGESPWVSVLASFLMMTSTISLEIHSMAWSEPLFIFLGFLAFFLMTKYLESQQISFLMAASLTSALAVLARYAGITVVATGVFAILLLSKETWKKRSQGAVIFFLISTVPLILWVARNLAVADTATARQIAFHPMTLGHLEAALGSVSTWLFPGINSSLERTSLLIVLALLASIFLLARRDKNRTGKGVSGEGVTKLSLLLTIFIGMYGLMLVAAISFLDAYMPIYNRQLYPIYVATLVLTVCMASRFSRVLAKTPLVRLSLIVLCLFFSSFYLSQGISWLVFSYHHGRGYSSQSWRESKLIARIKVLEPHAPVFTNAPDAVYLLTGRPATMLPRKVDTATGKLNEDYPTQLVATRSQLGKRNAVVVYFKTITWRWYLPSEEELEKELDLRQVAREKDGSIYRLAR